MTKSRKALLLLFSLTTGLTALLMGGLLIKQYAARLLPPTDRVQGNYSAQDVPTDSALPSPTFPSSFNEPEVAPSRIPTHEAANPRVDIQKPVLTSPTPTPEYLRYDGVSLSGQALKVWFRSACEPLTIHLPPFNVHAWNAEVFSDGTFAVGSDNAVAWEHLGYSGLWIHSGLDWRGSPQTAFPLHDYLERRADGEVRRPDEFNAALQNCLVGSLARVSNGSETSLSRVTAAIRVPSPGVEELAGHVMDLVPYLAETYPGNGFEDLSSPALLLYFCGRRLSTEPKNPNAEFWAQARIIIALEPAD